MLDFKGIFGAIMREGICYDLRSRVDAKACFSTIVRCTCLLPNIKLTRVKRLLKLLVTVVMIF